MKRHRRRSWIKLWTTGWLHGSIRWQLTSEERGVWADLLALAGECGQEGAIADNDDKALPRKFIANQLNIPQTLLDRVIAKCKHDGRVLENENECITLANWSHYQSEYDRQKPYREAQKDKGSPPVAPSFEAYKERKQKEYLDLDIDEEWERCQIWYKDNKKRIKSPSNALGNWLRKAREIKSGSRNTNPKPEPVNEPVNNDGYTVIQG